MRFLCARRLRVEWHPARPFWRCCVVHLWSNRNQMRRDQNCCAQWRCRYFSKFWNGRFTCSSDSWQICRHILRFSNKHFNRLESTNRCFNCLCCAWRFSFYKFRLKTPQRDSWQVHAPFDIKSKHKHTRSSTLGIVQYVCCALTPLCDAFKMLAKSAGRNLAPAHVQSNVQHRNKTEPLHEQWFCGRNWIMKFTQVQKSARTEIREAAFDDTHNS